MPGAMNYIGLSHGWIDVVHAWSHELHRLKPWMDWCSSCLEPRTKNQDCTKSLGEILVLGSWFLVPGMNYIGLSQILLMRFWLLVHWFLVPGMAYVVLIRGLSKPWIVAAGQVLHAPTHASNPSIVNSHCHLFTLLHSLAWAVFRWRDKLDYKVVALSYNFNCRMWRQMSPCPGRTRGQMSPCPGRTLTNSLPRSGMAA